MLKQTLTVLAMLTALNSFSQSQHEVIQEGHSRILKGIINREHLSTDTAFKWFQQNQAGYTPNAETVNTLKSKATQLQWVVFGGTWCPDTRAILPKFFSILDAAGIQQDHVTLIGVDRSKKTISHLTEALNITNVPTIILYKDGKEIGRVIEYGKTGQWDKELGEIAATIK